MGRASGSKVERGGKVRREVEDGGVGVDEAHGLGTGVESLKEGKEGQSSRKGKGKVVHQAGACSIFTQNRDISSKRNSLVRQIIYSRSERAVPKLCIIVPVAP